MTSSQPSEAVGIVFQVMAADRRRCLCCGQVLTREKACEHSKVACKPPANPNCDVPFGNA